MFNSIQVVQWTETPAGPTDNPLYLSIIDTNASTSTSTVYTFDLDVNSKVQFSDGYSKYLARKTADQGRQDLIELVLTFVFGGIFFLAIVLISYELSLSRNVKQLEMKAQKEGLKLVTIDLPRMLDTDTHPT